MRYLLNPGEFWGFHVHDATRQATLGRGRHPVGGLPSNEGRWPTSIMTCRLTRKILSVRGRWRPYPAKAGRSDVVMEWRPSVARAVSSNGSAGSSAPPPYGHLPCPRRPLPKPVPATIANAKSTPSRPQHAPFPGVASVFTSPSLPRPFASQRPDHVTAQTSHLQTATATIAACLSHPIVHSRTMVTRNKRWPQPMQPATS